MRLSSTSITASSSCSVAPAKSLKSLYSMVDFWLLARSVSRTALPTLPSSPLPLLFARSSSATTVLPPRTPQVPTSRPLALFPVAAVPSMARLAAAAIFVEVRVVSVALRKFPVNPSIFDIKSSDCRFASRSEARDMACRLASSSRFIFFLRASMSFTPASMASSTIFRASSRNRSASLADRGSSDRSIPSNSFASLPKKSEFREFGRVSHEVPGSGTLLPLPLPLSLEPPGHSLS
mmetsp:Transcript_19515/g.40229  ORF Transcript_19515/g.40229 Transcript_19515/m.40229 type:complete len:236 (-) Transcript_19515:517-1224(-)